MSCLLESGCLVNPRPGVQWKRTYARGYFIVVKLHGFSWMDTWGTSADSVGESIPSYSRDTQVVKAINLRPSLRTAFSKMISKKQL